MAKEKRPDWLQLVAWIDRLEDARSLDSDSTARFRTIHEFMEMLYATQVVYSFDWPKWQEVAEHLSEDPAALRAATLSDLRKLLTVHARKDRFCDGHFEAVFDSGHLVAVLREVATRFRAP